jgi:SAM-dependent methyltransferase
MVDHTSSQQKYVLGNHPEELARLDRQAASIERPTRLLLQAAGIKPGMRVLDLGTGLGHVARIVAEFVGPTGTIVGIDRSGDALAVARTRAQEAGVRHLTFEEGEVHTWRAAQPFDAIVARLLLFHVPDPIAAVKHHVRNLGPGGEFVAVDFDLGNTRAEPPVPLVTEAKQWVEDAFRAAGAWPRIGSRLGIILERAGLTGVTTFGVQAYLAPTDPAGPTLLAGVVRSLAPTMIAHGIATAEQIGIETLEQRLTNATRDADAAILLPTVVGAWGFTSAA